MGCSKPIVKVSLICLIIGLIIFVIGYAAPYWSKFDLEAAPSVIDRHYYRGTVHAGLWETCEDYERWSSEQGRGRRYRIDECFSFLGHPDKHPISKELRAAQFIETLGLIGVVATITILLLELCVDSLKGKRIVSIIAALCCLASGGCILLGTIVYGSQDAITDSLSWAFALTIVSGVLFVIIGIVILVGAVLNK
ncbi:hypothetical protein EGW08_003357 [Elysia chlorotica]|uniref:Claudin n=1 Tax=Elysia chlorotica TaxID=188477 RepID=A0A3S1BQB7_ELYCH|nr:hypothetical protein EGW08_003357 [Elysia chlorotica]